MSHTKGPWIVCETLDKTFLSIEQDREALTNEEPSIVAEVDLCGDGITATIGKANARLIAAAPDLLAALKELLADHQEHNGGRCCKSDMIGRAQAALAKAKGE